MAEKHVIDCDSTGTKNNNVLQRECISPRAPLQSSSRTFMLPSNHRHGRLSFVPKLQSHGALSDYPYLFAHNQRKTKYTIASYYLSLLSAMLAR